MNSSSVISSSCQLLLEEIQRAFHEIHRRFDEFDARMERRFSRTQAVLEQQGAAEKLRIDGFEQFDTTQHVVADNWGGLFNSVSFPPMKEQHDAEVVPDNWEGLFEQPGHASEERGLDLSAVDNFTRFASSDPICVESGIASTDPGTLPDAGQELLIPLPHSSASSCLGSVLECDPAYPEPDEEEVLSGPSRSALYSLSTLIRSEPPRSSWVILGVIPRVAAAVDPKRICSDEEVPECVSVTLDAANASPVAPVTSSASVKPTPAPSSATVSDDMFRGHDEVQCTILGVQSTPTCLPLCVYLACADAVPEALRQFPANPSMYIVPTKHDSEADLPVEAFRSDVTSAEALVFHLVRTNSVSEALPLLQSMVLEDDKVASTLPNWCSVNCPTGRSREYSAKAVSAGMFALNLVQLRQPWPPPTELRFLSRDAGLRPPPWPSEQLTVNWCSCVLSRPSRIVSTPQNCSGIFDQQPQMEVHVIASSLEDYLVYHYGAFHTHWCTSDVCFVLKSHVRLVPAHDTRASKSGQLSTPRIFLCQFHSTQCHVVLICNLDKEKVILLLQHDPSILTLNSWHVSCSVITLVHSTKFCLFHGILLELMEAFIDIFLSWLVDHMIVLRKISRELILWLPYPPKSVELKSCIIRSVPATALQELLTCIRVLSVSIAGCALIQELVQQKCCGKYRCFVLEVIGQKFQVARGKAKDHWQTKQDLLLQILFSALSCTEVLNLNWSIQLQLNGSARVTPLLSVATARSIAKGLLRERKVVVVTQIGMEAFLDCTLTSVLVMDTHLVASCFCRAGLSMNGYIEFQPWPPPRQDCNNLRGDCNTLLGETIMLCCNLWFIFGSGWFSLLFVPPWSLHLLFEIKCDGIQLWPFFCSYAVLVLFNISVLVVPPWMSFACIQIADGALVWSFIIGRNTSGTYASGATTLSVTDDGSRCDPCALTQLDSAKPQRNFTVPWSPCVWACNSALMITCSVLLGAFHVAQSVSLEFCWGLMMLDLGLLTTNKEDQYGANGSSLTYSLAHELFATTMLISMAAEGNTRANILPLGLPKSRIIWNSGGSILLHRLGGKPTLKERGMLGIGHGWAVARAWAVSPVQISKG